MVNVASYIWYPFQLMTAYTCKSDVVKISYKSFHAAASANVHNTPKKENFGLYYYVSCGFFFF